MIKRSRSHLLLGLVLLVIVLIGWFRIGAPAPPSQGSASSSVSAPRPIVHRFVVVPINRNTINPWRITANQKIEEMVRRLFGPDDVLVIIYVTGSFSPQANVRLKVEFPPLAQELVEDNYLRTPQSVPERNRLQAMLNGVWRRVDTYQDAVAKVLRDDSKKLTPETHAGEPINLNAPLVYALRLLDEAPARYEKRLIFFGPMVHMEDSASQPRFEFTPPKGITLTGTHFLNLFAARENDTTFEDHRASIIAAFDKCGIKVNRQDIKDRAMSAALGATSILPESPVPKLVPRVL